MRWKPACRGWKKRGGSEPTGSPEAGTPADDPGRAGGLGEPAHASQTHARLGIGGRTPAGRQLGSAWGGGEQRHGGKPPGCMARTDDQAPDRWDAWRTGAGVSYRVLADPLQPAPLPGAVL